jgi:hypothetical protein
VRVQLLYFRESYNNGSLRIRNDTLNMLRPTKAMPTAPQEQVTTEAMKREGMVTREICTGPWGLLIKRFPSHLECGILFQVNFCTSGFLSHFCLRQDGNSPARVRTTARTAVQKYR